MKFGIRELCVVLLAIVSVGAFLRFREMNTVAGGPALDPSEELVVWNSHRPVGQTWANLGPKGGIEYPENSGIDGKGKALTLRMTGEGYRACGLNWKGWYPADAHDDVSSFHSLVFHVRQIGTIENFELRVSLVDNFKRSNGETASNTQYVVGDGALKRIDGEWRKVILPLSKFAQNKPLKLDRIWGIDFASEGTGLAVIQIDRISFSKERPRLPTFSEKPSYQSSATLLLDAKRHQINDGIYGVCDLPVDQLREYGIPLTRWGGNTSSRFNWKINAENGASDWFFKNRGQVNDGGYLKHIKTAQSIGATTYQTIPMLGWVAKDSESYGFSIKKYGAQKQTEPGYPDIGNGIGTDGKFISGNDPTDTSMAVGPDFIAEAVTSIAKNAGAADAKGVKYWVLDNEPMIWHQTHRDVRPNPLGYDELWDRTVKYAEAIKQADPTAKVAGFCSWGWTDLYYSSKDQGNDNYASHLDNKDHGGMPLAEWFIRQCGEYRKKHGKSLIDVFDFHWYPQAQVGGRSPYQGRGMDTELNELRLRSTRDLWDPEYLQESWIRQTHDGRSTEVIRRVRGWIERYNPGMEMCLGEYNFGGADNISGGLAQADVFGILAREQVDLAFIWHTPEGSQNLAWQLFRNYDAKGGRFGDRYIPTTSRHGDLALYAARRSDGATTIAVINKSLGGACELSLEAIGLKGKLQVWRFDSASNQVIEVPAETTTINGQITLRIPAASASMLIVK